MTAAEDSRPADRREDDLTEEEEAESAAAEAGEIGGDVPPDSEDPAEQPLIEAGEGEAEGFELAEERLVDVAEHGDMHRFPDRDVPPAEEGEGAESGEPDEAAPADQ